MIKSGCHGCLGWILMASGTFSAILSAHWIGISECLQGCASNNPAPMVAMAASIVWFIVGTIIVCKSL
jgi:hypothetical protein